MIIADTDVLIDFLENRGPAADRIALELESGSLATTAITRFELLSGVSNPRQERAVADLLAALPAFPFDGPAADRAAGVRRALEGKGESIGMGDSMIAGIALCRGAVLLTRNRRHFERVDGLQLSSLK